MVFDLILPIDNSVHAWFSMARTGTLTDVFSTFTVLGNWWFVIPLALVACVFFYLRGMGVLVMPLAVTLLLGESVTYATKLLVARPRPMDALIAEHDPSFPSGHAMIAIALYGFLIFVAVRYAKRDLHKKLMLAAVGPLVVLIGVSRLYLGVHYPSDVIAGYVIGSLALLCGIHLVNKTEAKRSEVQS